MGVLVEKKATLAGHRDCIYTLEHSGLSNIFFSAGGDGMVVQWDLSAPDVGVLLAKVPASIYALCFIPGFNHLITGQNFEGIHVIDINSRKEIKSLKIGASSIFDIKYYDGQLYLAEGNGMVTIINYDSWEITNRIALSNKSARSIAVNYACKEFAVGYSDNYIRVFDFKNLKLKYEFAAHYNSVFTLAYSPDSKFLYSGSRDAKLKKWDVFNGYTLDQMIVAHMYALNHIAFSPDGNNFVTGSMDKSIKIWDTQEMKLLKVIDHARHAGHGTSINKLLWSNYNNELLSASDDKMISVWKLDIQ